MLHRLPLPHLLPGQPIPSVKAIGFLAMLATLTQLLLTRTLRNMPGIIFDSLPPIFTMCVPTGHLTCTRNISLMCTITFINSWMGDHLTHPPSGQAENLTRNGLNPVT